MVVELWLLTVVAIQACEHIWGGGGVPQISVPFWGVLFINKSYSILGYTRGPYFWEYPHTYNYIYIYVYILHCAELFSRCCMHHERAGATGV